MRRLCLIVLATACCAATSAVADEELPFDAYVVPSEAAVYSGPAEPRYVTHEIPRGTKVEVYERRDEWLGIRPPQGSFSWVPSAAMTMTEEPGVAEAAEGGVASWIGSAAERVQEHQSSVQLKRGEQVEVLGKKEVETGDGKREVWLKIAPPAGEFRWIHASQVSSEAPAAFTVAQPDARDAERWASRLAGRERSETSAEAPVNMPSATRGPFHRSSMELRDLTRPPIRQAAFQQEIAGDTVPPAEPPKDKSLSADGFVPRRPRAGPPRTVTSPRGTPSARMAAAGRAENTTAARRPQTAANSPPVTPVEPTMEFAENSQAGISSAAVQRRLEEIDVSLSLMVSGDRSQWNLAALKREVQQLVEQGATPVDRGEARFMLEKIQRFAEAFGVEDDDGSLDLPVGSVAARKAALQAATAPQYDGAGYLAPVRAARPVAPYALLDQSGNRICYVTPVPGFNLREYENRKIGIFGKRGYMAGESASHLLAERVVDLDKQVR